MANIADFFNDHRTRKDCFGQDDIYEIENEELEYSIKMVNSKCTKNKSFIYTFQEGGKYVKLETAHEGEEFGYVLSGTVHIHLGSKKYKAKKVKVSIIMLMLITYQIMVKRGYSVVGSDATIILKIEINKKELRL